MLEEEAQGVEKLLRLGLPAWQLVWRLLQVSAGIPWDAVALQIDCIRCGNRSHMSGLLLAARAEAVSGAEV